MSHSWNYTPQQYSKDLLVRHMAQNHHSNFLYRKLEEDFVKNIEIQDNPSLDYYAKMKGLYMDQLDNGIREHNERKQRYHTEMEETKKDYNENVNGLVKYLEKEQDKREQFIKKCLAKQQIRAKAYRDVYGEKNQKAQKLIDYNCEDPLLLARSQFLSKQNTYHVPKLLDLEQKQSIRHSYEPTPYYSINTTPGLATPLNRQIQNKQNKSSDRVSHIRTRTEEHEFNENNATSKIKEDLMKLNLDRSRRVYKLHNPITNPIEYHVENPYFLQKMQDKYRIK